jgi:hypothetical protein
MTDRKILVRLYDFSDVGRAGYHIGTDEGVFLVDETLAKGFAHTQSLKFGPGQIYEITLNDAGLVVDLRDARKFVPPKRYPTTHEGRASDQMKI